MLETIEAPAVVLLSVNSTAEEGPSVVVERPPSLVVVICLNS